MSLKVDKAEIDEARKEANRALHVWKHDPDGDHMTTDEMFFHLLHWVGIEISAAIQERDERGAWP
jgi:hypothetical protein